MSQLVPIVSQQPAATVLLAVTASSANTCLPPAVANKGGSNRCAYMVSNLGTKTAYFETGTGLTVLAAAVPTASVKAAQTLTNDGTNPVDGSSVVIGTRTYTFQSTLTDVDGHVKIGASNTATMTNLFHAINGSGGTIGTDYAASTTPNTQVVATNPSGTTVTVTALVAGAAGNSIVTTASTSPNSHGTWGAGVLASGADNTGGTPIAAGNQLMISVPKNHLAVAAICGGSDSTTLYITPA